MRTFRLLLFVPILALLLFSQVAQAKDYIIEVVFFENLFAAQSSVTPALYVPRTSGAFTLNSEKAVQAGFSVIEEDLQLIENVDAIRQSRHYRLLRHFAWRQPGLDNQNAQALRINIGNGFKVYIPSDYQIYPDFIPANPSESLEGNEQEIRSTVINGTLKVRLGRFLHLDAKLVYTDTETANSFRMNHSRKMRSRELHYIDNPRFGMLVKILPVPE